MAEYLSPFPWFGGKTRAADLIWSRLGDVPNFGDPFFGGGAVLLNRPTDHHPKYETINDLDCYLANFWRASQAEPDQVARWADWPINEADLHARHEWLVDQIAFRERMHTDPDYYDCKIAGWWVWGISQWIGSGWCTVPAQQIPCLHGHHDVHKTLKRPHLWRGGTGIHRTSHKHPEIHSTRKLQRTTDLYDYMEALAARLRRVRVCCGDWRRILGPSPTYKLGLTGILLDPPYSAPGRDPKIYNHDSSTIAQDVARWARKNQDNPKLRIALCGYEGEHDLPGWECVAWTANGGYGHQSNNNSNRHRERIWFSPHCLHPTDIGQMTLKLERPT